MMFDIWNHKCLDLETHVQQLREQRKFLLGTQTFTDTELQDLENYLKILIILVTTTQIKLISSSNKSNKLSSNFISIQHLLQC